MINVVNFLIRLSSWARFICC